MPGAQGYAVVSCHVERPLDDEVWRRYSELLRRRPGGFEIASLMRPPADGEDGGSFAARAREAAELGPYGHHIHWTSPTHARPLEAAQAGAGGAVLREGGWLREQGLEPRLFCGGGWYMDAGVMAAVAELGYSDCTATAWRPAYLAEGSPRAALAQPAWVRLEDGHRVLELPTTHSLGAAARALAGALPEVVHVHFHDYELLDARRRLALGLMLAALARRRRPARLDRLTAETEVAWSEVCAG